MERKQLKIAGLMIIALIILHGCSNPVYLYKLDDNDLIHNFPDVFKEMHHDQEEVEHYQFVFYDCVKSVNGVLENVLVSSKADCVDTMDIKSTQQLDVYVHAPLDNTSLERDYHIYSSTRKWEAGTTTNHYEGQIILYKGKSSKDDMNVYCDKRYVYKPYKRSIKGKDVDVRFFINRDKNYLIVDRIVNYQPNKYGGSKPVEYEMQQFFKKFILFKV